MTFTSARAIAMARSAEFRSHDARVRGAQENGASTPCMIFSVGGEETYYYGFDGVDLHAGKHSRARAARLIESGDVFVIR